MQEDSTETLARSQLETLYRLGILKRSSEDEEQSRSSENGLQQRHDAFLAALPPPSAVYSLTSRMLQVSVDDSSSSERSGSSKSSDVFAGSSGMSSFHLLEISRHRQPYKPRRSSSRRSSRSSAASSDLPQQMKRDSRRTLRILFRQWKSFIGYCREKTRRRAVADAFLKQSVITKWASFLKQRRYEHEKKRHLDVWKVSRAISQWAQWKQRCRLLRGLLSGGRRSFMGRLIRQRIWRRWTQFTKQRKDVQGILAQRTCYLHHRLVRLAWTELRIHTFRARQDDLALRRCVTGMRNFHAILERHRLLCVQHQQKVNLRRKRGLWQRWRAFADNSSRDRHLAWRVQFDVRRRRFFLLWCEVARTVNHVAQLRSKLSFRGLYQHFSAWKTTAKAIQVGSQVGTNREKRLRAICFEAFKNHARFSAHCNRAALTLTHRRLAAAVNYLQVWVTERKRRRDGIRRIRQMWETRLVRRVWLTGWLRVHHKRLAVKHSCIALEVRYFDGWKRFQRIRQSYYLQEKRADASECKLCYRRAFAGWKNYLKRRRQHQQQLAKAQEHYRTHLLQRGVVILWGAVYQNTQNSLRGHHLRQSIRTSLKRRLFREWRSWTQSRQRVSERLHDLQQSLGYQKSICNPNRRIWDRWLLFVSVHRQRHHCDRHFQLRKKRQVLFDWHRQAKEESIVRVFNLHKRRRAVGVHFSQWKSRVEKWKKVGAICELAEKVYERKLSTRVIRDWRCWSTYFRRVRLCGESIQHQRKRKFQALRFHEWREKCDVRQCCSRLRRSRERQLLRACFISWFRHSVQQKLFTRKLAYFQKVYGKYPASSLVSRVWRRWQRTCNQTRYIKVLHRKHQIRQARRCWSHWKSFHAACNSFRVWRRVARTIASSNNRLGMRLRCFRRSRRRKLQRCMMNEWKYLVERLRNLQERQSFWKHKINRELEGAKWRSDQATRHHLRNWFRRWCIAHSQSSHLARNHFLTRLLQKVVLSWWKTTIHSKQERVLVEAQQTIGKLSYYHPQQQVYTAQVKRTDNQKEKKKLQKRRAKVAPTSARAESMRRMRRMLDPTENASYSRFYLESGQELLPNEPNRGANNVKFAPHATNLVVSHLVSKPESRRRIYSDQSPHVDQVHQVDHENCSYDEADDRNSNSVIAEETTCGQLMGNRKSRCDASRVSPKAVPRRSLSVPPAITKQVRFELQKSHSDAETHEFLRQEPYQIPPQLIHTPLSSNPMVSENVLPLFDDERTSAGVGKPKSIAQHSKQIVVAEQPIDFTSDLRYDPSADHLEQAFCIHQTDSSDPSISAPAREGHRTSPTTDSRGYEYEVHLANNATPTVVDPKLSLSSLSERNENVDRHRKDRVEKKRNTTHKKRIKLVNASSNEATPLADILKLNDGIDTGCNEVGAGADTQWNDDPVCDAAVLKDIIGYYADSIMTRAGDNDPGDGVTRLKTTRNRVCFRIARDLALLQNDFYIDELFKVYDASFKEKSTELPRYAVDTDKREEQARLELFLEQLVENHPAYRKYVDHSLRRTYLQSSVPLSALSWLAQHHLRPHISLQKKARSRPRKSKAYWVWEPMPADMDVALEKLLPTITKYMRVLGQFFLRQAVQSSSTTYKPQDYRVSKTAFTSLMKQVRVSPQLFHRRELENAVRQSCCSSPESEELNFPEFIEALVRCSCNLRWGELDGTKHAGESNSGDTVIVIKFVMLIFAMEGQGSVLKKRNEDVSAILGFLGQQQKKKQAEKMFRFRKMLAENKRRTRVSSNHQPPSVWNQVRLQFPPKRSPTMSPTRSHDTLTESWDGGSPRHVSTEPFVFDAQTNQPYDLESPPSPNEEVIDRRSEGQSQPDPAEFGKGDHDQGNLDSGSINGANLRPSFLSEVKLSIYAESMADVSGDVSHQGTQALESTEQELMPDAPAECDTDTTIHYGQKENPFSATHLKDVGSTATGSIGDATCEQEHQVTTSFQSVGLVKPMEKDEFLREILNSIGDVELILNQPRFTGSNYSQHGRRRRQSKQANAPTDLTQCTVHTDSSGLIPSLSDLAADNFLHDYSTEWRQVGIFSTCSSAGEDSEVQVRDPMLNYLTDCERFTESTDKTSLVAVADMAGLPFTQDSISQDHIPEPDTWASQEIRPSEEVTVNTSSQTSSHDCEMHGNTIK